MSSIQIPRRRTQPYPIVIIPGAAQTATNFTGTPDGREGWAQYFLRRGYAVYIVEQPGRGRSGYQPDVDGPQGTPHVQNVENRFTATERATFGRRRTCTRNGPAPASPAIRSSISSTPRRCRSCSKPELIQTLNRDAAAALLDKIGPAIVMTHSQSGAYGWPIVEARPNLVKALIQVEPSAPPVHDMELDRRAGLFQGRRRRRAVGPHRDPAEIFAGGLGPLATVVRAAGQARRPRPRQMLAAEARPRGNCPNCRRRRS